MAGAAFTDVTRVGPGVRLGPQARPGGQRPGAPKPAKTGGQRGRGPAVNPLLNPNAPLSGQALLHAAQALANAQENPTIQGIKDALAANNQQTTNAVNLTGGYFNQLGGLAQQNAQQQGQIASGLNTQLQGIGQDEQNQLRGIGQDALSNFAKYSPQSDQQNSLAQPALQALQAEIARQQGLAAQDQGAFRSFGATQGTNFQGLSNAQLGTDALAGQQALRTIAQAGQLKNEPLNSKLASAIATRGALVGTDLAKLRQQEIANQISRAGLGIRQESATAALSNAQTNRGKLGVLQQNANTSRMNALTNARLRGFETNPFAVGSPAWKAVQDANNKNWEANPNAVGSLAWSRAHKTTGAAGGGLKPLTTSQNDQWFAHLGNVSALVQTMEKGGYKNSKGAVQPAQTPAAIRQALSSKYDPLMVQAAFDLLASQGAISPQTAAAMHAAGLRGGSWNGQPITVKQISTVGGAIASGAFSG